MDATPYLVQIAKALKAAKLEAILIGNGGAALQGAPVSTLDLDFFYRDTALNRKKLAAVALQLGAKLTQLVSGRYTPYRLDFCASDLAVDFVTVAAGIRCFASLRNRANLILIEETELMVESWNDIVKPKPKAMTKRERDLSLLREACDAAELEMIRARLALPMHKRTNFLRVRIPGAPNNGTAL